MQPFEAGAAHPLRRALCAARQEIERRANAETNAPRIATLSYGVGHHFLLRRADTDEGEARGLRGGKRGGADDGFGLLLQIHGRAVPAHVGEIVAALQLRDCLFVTADNGYRLAAIDDVIEQTLRQIRARGHGEIEASGATEFLQNPAVVQQQPRRLIERTARGFRPQLYHVIQIRRRNIGKARVKTGACGDRIKGVSKSNR